METVMVPVAAVLLKVVLSLLYCAVTLLAPVDNCEADTIRVADAVAPDPESCALPNVVVPNSNVMEPVGRAPLDDVTVAVRVVDWPAASAAELAETEICGVRRLED